MRFLCCLIVLGVVAALPAAQEARAQGVPGGGYQPTQPTFSPWMSLYQHNSGPLDNYHTFVRPQMQLQDTLRQQRTILQDQGEGIQELSGKMNAVQQGRSPAHPTGAGSVFMDYSHYYDASGSANRQRATVQRPTSRASRRAY
jgi:hypothetical protein